MGNDLIPRASHSKTLRHAISLPYLKIELVNASRCGCDTISEVEEAAHSLSPVGLSKATNNEGLPRIKAINKLKHVVSLPQMEDEPRAPTQIQPVSNETDSDLPVASGSDDHVTTELTTYRSRRSRLSKEQSTSEIRERPMKGRPSKLEAHIAMYKRYWDQSPPSLASPGDSVKEMGLSDLTGQVDRDELQYIGGGSYGDVYRGKWKESREEGQPEVVVKVLRSAGTVKESILRKNLKMLRRELAVWQNLRHENIVPLVGIALVSAILPSIVSLWMRNGTLRSYLECNPSTSRIHLTLGIARGLGYLHNSKPIIVHGDLKADNVLIDENGNPRLCDFGLSRVLEDSDLWQTSANSAPGTLRWKAPELLRGDQRMVTIYSDIYAYGLTCLEVYTGKLPFHHYHNDGQFIWAVMWGKEIPRRPSEEYGISDELWNLWVTCWNNRPEARSSANQLISNLERVIFFFSSPNPPLTKFPRKPTLHLQETLASLADLFNKVDVG